MKRLASTALFLWSSFWSVSALGEPARPAKHLLPREVAQDRAQRVSEVSYDLSYELDAKSKDFRGETTVRFQLAESAAPLSLDFTGGKPESILLNGKPVPASSYNGFFFVLPGEALQKGANTLTIKFTHPYSTDGAGFYRFQDPADKNVYVYTNFEPYDANKFFPAFDQPDLKATYTLKVKAPKDWVVISSTMETGAQAQGAFKTWTFPTSAKFSTYLFSLHAGPYKMWTQNFRIPLRLFARQSIADTVDPELWFDMTAKGFNYFEAYFDEAYPFKKYDQVIVPDFNSGAMENVAAVTFSERYLSRGAATKAQRKRIGNVILHEMAHMWFGNLVTMKWWDDLWLNESFATIMAYKGMAEAVKVPETWRDFYAHMKTDAYWEDQLVTTHPITADVGDTQVAMANFDGITYDKGASVMKQLAFFLGEEKFRDGMRLYFDEHQWKNTQLKDFMGALEKASGKNLKTFTTAWLETAGLNTVGVRVQCDDDEIDSLKIIQTPDERFGGLREHKTRIALMGKDDKGGVVVQDVIDLAYKGAETEIEAAEGKACPLLVYPNEGDFDYARVSLDQTTLKNAEAEIGNIRDPMLRTMFWQAYWEMVRDARFPVQRFAVLLLNNLQREDDMDVALSMVKFIDEGVLVYLREASPAQAESFRQQFATVFESRLKLAQEKTDWQKLWWDSYVAMAKAPDEQKKLIGWLNGRDVPAGFQIDQDRRWNVIVRLSQLNAEQADKLRRDEAKRDKSHTGVKMNLIAQAVKPDTKDKERWWKEIFNPKSELTTALKATVAGNLFPNEQIELRRNFAGNFYKQFPGIANDSKNNLGIKVVRGLAPAYCKGEGTQKLGAFLDTQKDLPAPIVKRLKVAKQEDERCERIKTLATSYQAGSNG